MQGLELVSPNTEDLKTHPTASRASSKSSLDVTEVEREGRGGEEKTKCRSGGSQNVEGRRERSREERKKKERKKKERKRKIGGEKKKEKNETKKKKEGGGGEQKPKRGKKKQKEKGERVRGEEAKKTLRGKKNV